VKKKKEDAGESVEEGEKKEGPDETITEVPLLEE
jgi:hypothetical protein